MSTAAGLARPLKSAPFIEVSVQDRDNAQFLLPGAAVGLVVAGFLALVGLPGVDLHGPLHRLGVMDPFCGGTRALRLAARGDLLGALQWNPLSPILLAAAVAYLVRLGAGLTTGRWLNVRVANDRRLWVGVGLALLSLEARQQSLAPMLMRHGY